LRLAADPAEAVDDDAPRLALGPPERGPRQADDAARRERRQPADRRADRLDPLARVDGPVDQRQRQDRRHERHAVRDLEAALPDELQAAVILGVPTQTTSPAIISS